MGRPITYAIAFFFLKLFTMLLIIFERGNANHLCIAAILTCLGKNLESNMVCSHNSCTEEEPFELPFSVCSLMHSHSIVPLRKCTTKLNDFAKINFTFQFQIAATHLFLKKILDVSIPVWSCFCCLSYLSINFQWFRMFVVD